MVEKQNTSPSRRIVFIFSINLFIIVALLILAELYFRHRYSYIVLPGAEQMMQSGLVQSEPSYLVNYTPKGRRLIPGTRVIIQNHRLSGRDIEMSINSLGFRDHELSNPRPADEIRVLMLGDSITWGDYLQADEVYVERAQSYLADRFPGMKVAAHHHRNGSAITTNLSFLLKELAGDR